MKTFILLIITFSITASLFSQNQYFRTTTSTLQSNLNIEHFGAISIGGFNYTSGAKLGVYDIGNVNFLLKNQHAYLQIGISDCNGCFAPTSKAGTSVFRNLGNSHNMIFTMPNDNNDGTTNIRFNDNSNYSSLVIHNNGKITIGTEHFDSDNYNLYVKNGIKTEKIKVEFADVNGWADYVFHDSYQLMPLYQLKEYLLINNHLPEIPDANSVVENGLELKEMNVLLLKKIEEMTLYLLEINDKIISQEREINHLKQLLEIKKN